MTVKKIYTPYKTTEEKRIAANSAASMGLKHSWSDVVQEVLSTMNAFGSNPTLDIKRAMYSRDHAAGYVEIPIISTRKIGWLNKSQNTGVVCIKGGNILEIEIRDKSSQVHAAVNAGFPSRNEVKRQLREYVPHLAQLRVG